MIDLQNKKLLEIQEIQTDYLEDLMKEIKKKWNPEIAESKWLPLNNSFNWCLEMYFPQNLHTLISIIKPWIIMKEFEQIYDELRSLIGTSTNQY